MLFSIVVPTYRRNTSLKTLLVEICRQTRFLHDKVEILVIDNCPDCTARSATSHFDGIVRYISEKRPGVANARNTGVRYASGEYVIFIDDDQLPAPNWLLSYHSVTSARHSVYFGPVLPDFEEPVPPHAKAILESLFTRDLKLESQANITRFRAYLGTGNSMFNRKQCFFDAEPFDPRIDVGEDVQFLRKLAIERGVEFFWCAGAEVREFVPKTRMTVGYMRRRKFRNGQLRCLVEAGAGDWPSTAIWMLVGLIQSAGYAAFTAAFFPFSRERSAEFGIKLTGGVGKLLWWLPLRS